MIVRLEVSASEKVAARSQYEPNHYSVLVAVDQLSLEHPDEILGQADTLFRRAKAAIENAKRLDGLGHAPPEPAFPSLPSTNGNGQHREAPPATEKQVRMLHQLASQKRMSRDELEELCRQAVGHASHELSKFDASRVISVLQEGRGS